MLLKILVIEKLIEKVINEKVLLLFANYFKSSNLNLLKKYFLKDSDEMAIKVLFFLMRFYQPEVIYHFISNT